MAHDYWLRVAIGLLKDWEATMRGRKFTRAEYSHAQTVLTNPADWLLVKVDEWTWTVAHRFRGQARQVRNERWKCY